MQRVNNLQNWKLYIITDEELSGGRSHIEIAREAINGGADVIQLRDKTADSRTLYETGLKIRQLTLKHEVSFIVNDRLDIALAVDADGVHVGQKDLPAQIARKLIGPNKILGVSASSLEEAITGEKDSADYLGVGPVFEARSTKSDSGEPLGLKLIKEVREHCHIPVVAIGGINHANVKEVKDAGADAVAVISAVVSAENIQDAAAKLKTILNTKKETK